MTACLWQFLAVKFLLYLSALVLPFAVLLWVIEEGGVRPAVLSCLVPIWFHLLWKAVVASWVTGGTKLWPMSFRSDHSSRIHPVIFQTTLGLP